MSDEDNGWDEYKKLVLSELKRIDDKMGRDFSSHMKNDEKLAAEFSHTLTEIHRDLVEMRKDISGIEIKLIGGISAELASLKVKAGAIGLLGGLIPAAVAILIVYLESRTHS